MSRPTRNEFKLFTFNKPPKPLFDNQQKLVEAGAKGRRGMAGRNRMLARLKREAKQEAGAGRQ